jgi:hypothetical protein
MSNEDTLTVLGASHDNVADAEADCEAVRRSRMRKLRT